MIRLYDLMKQYNKIGCNDIRFNKTVLKSDAMWRATMRYDMIRYNTMAQYNEI